MANLFSYEGKRVVVSGGGGAGMGAAAVEGLAELGAEIHVIDLKEPPVPVASHQVVDLRDPEAVTAAIDNIGGTINSLFNCAGLPGPPKTDDVNTFLVNLAAPRHLAAACAKYMPAGSAIASISSTAGASYLMNIAKWMPLVTTPDFASAKEWIESHPAEIEGGYAPSKEALIVWTMWAAKAYAERGIRLNCISPGPTDTPMMSDFESNVHETMPGMEGIFDAMAQGLGRHSTPAEQGWPMIFLNSDAASYISGENVNTDGGTMSGIMTGTITVEMPEM